MKPIIGITPMFDTDNNMVWLHPNTNGDEGQLLTRIQAFLEML